MDGNNNVGGWASQPVSFHDSQKAKTPASGQAGAFSNRTVISVPPNNTVVVLVPPTGLVSVEIKDRQVIVNTINNTYMPYPMTPESGQILFDRGVATLAQNKGYSIAEAADMADIGMKWAKANFGFDYSQAESQFMGWINGAPNRADNTRVERAADAGQRTESVASASESSSTPTEMSAADATANLRPSTAPAALASDGDVDSDPASEDVVALAEDDTAARAMDGDDSAEVASVSGDDIYATVQRPSTAPAVLVSEDAVEPDPVFEDDVEVMMNRPASAPAAVAAEEAAEPAEAFEDDVEVMMDRPASAPAALAAEEVAEPAEAFEDDVEVMMDRPASAPAAVAAEEAAEPAEAFEDDVEVMMDRPASAPAALTGEDAVEPAPVSEEAVEIMMDRPASAPPALAADEAVETAAAFEEDVDTTMDRPSTAPAALSGEGVVEPAAVSEEAVEIVMDRPASAPAATPTDVGTKAATASEVVIPKARPASAPATSGIGENGVSANTEVEASDGEQMVSQRSLLTDGNDYLDGVAELFAQPETAVDNKNTVASAGGDNIVFDRAIDAAADVSLQSEEINIDDDDVSNEEISVELEDSNRQNMDAGQVSTDPTDATSEYVVESASVSGEDVDVTVDRPSTAPATFASAQIAEPATAEPIEPIMVPPSTEPGQRPASAPAATSAESVADAASAEDTVIPGQRPASAPAALASAENGVSVSTEGEVSNGEQMVGQSSGLPDNDDYLDGIADLFAEPETVVDNKNTVASAESMAGDIVSDSPSGAEVDDSAGSDELNVDDGYFADQEMSVDDGNTQKMAAGVTMSVQSESVAPSDSGDDLDPGYLADDEMEFGQDDLNVRDGVRGDERMSATAVPTSSATEDDDGYFSGQESTESMVVPPDTSQIRETAQQRKAALQDSNQQLDPAEVEYSGPAGSGKKIIDEPLDLSNVESSGYAKPNKLKMNFPVGSKEYQEMVSDRKLLGVSSTYNEMSVARSAYKKLQENDSNLELSRDIVKAAEKYISFGVTGSKPLLREPDTVQQEALEALGLDKNASERAILLALIDQTSYSLDANKKTRHENRMKVLDKIHKTLFGRG